MAHRRSLQDSGVRITWGQRDPCHLSSIAPYGCLPLGEEFGGPRTRDTRSTGLSASVPPAADSGVDLGSSGYLGPPRTWTGGRRRNPGSQSPGATQAAPVVNKPENCQVHSSSSGALAIRGSSPGWTMPAGDIVKAFEAAHYALPTMHRPLCRGALRLCSG